MTILPFCSSVFNELGQRISFPSRSDHHLSVAGGMLPVHEDRSAQQQPAGRQQHLCGCMIAASSQEQPLSSQWRSSMPAWCTRTRTQAQAQQPAHHLLLLRVEDELAQVHVLNLLRDTYHEVSARAIAANFFRESKERLLFQFVP